MTCMAVLSAIGTSVSTMHALCVCTEHKELTMYDTFNVIRYLGLDSFPGGSRGEGFHPVTSALRVRLCLLNCEAVGMGIWEWNLR